MVARNLSENRARTGYRGYVASRPVRGVSFPQQMQNLVVRDYAARNGLHYLLSATEYAMPSCYLMLNAVLEELPKLQGLVFFSMFMLPAKKARRLEVFERILASGCELHAALENVALREPAGIAAFEDLLDVAFALPRLPMSGRYEKGETSMQDRTRDPFWSALTAAL
jgi:sporadic carbohydrate cluster protein (TIGR04323 family)